MLAFRNNIKNRFNNHCIISKTIRPDANHIIPQHICDEFEQFKHLKYNTFNGMMMTKSIHYEFDLYQYTFDIFNSTWVDHDHLLIPLLIPNKRQRLMISNYRDQQIKICRQSLPFLWVHYQIYHSVHYQNLTPDSRQRVHKNEYFKIMSQPEFGILLQRSDQETWNRVFIQNPGEILIINYHPSTDKYLIHYRNRAYSNQNWVSGEFIPYQYKNNYHNIMDQKKDPDFKVK